MKKKFVLITAGAAAIVVLGGVGIAYAATDGFEGSDRLTGDDLDRASSAALAEVGEGTVSEAERSDSLDHDYSVEVRLNDGRDVDVEMYDDFEVVRVDGVIPGTATAPTSSATPSATPSSGAIISDDTPITAEERASAEAAALAQVGSGTVTDLDRSDDGDHAWEVEVTGTDGRDVDVELAADFSVVRVDSDQ
jgi:uncharacterized membrane protein YkoI